MHRVTIEREPGGYTAVCVCRARSRLSTERWRAEAWELHHLDLVGRVRQHLSYGRTPPLTWTRDYYRAKAADPSTPKDDVPLWTQLADELDRRLGETGPVYEDERLW